MFPTKATLYPKILASLAHFLAIHFANPVRDNATTMETAVLAVSDAGVGRMLIHGSHDEDVMSSVTAALVVVVVVEEDVFVLLTMI